MYVLPWTDFTKPRNIQEIPVLISYKEFRHNSKNDEQISDRNSSMLLSKVWLSLRRSWQNSQSLDNCYRKLLYRILCLRKMFGHKRDKVPGDRRKLHNKELNDLYSPNIVLVIKLRRMRWAEYVARMGERWGVFSVFVGKPEGRRSLTRPRHRWENDLKMGFQEVGYRDMDWIELAQNWDRLRALENALINLGVP